MLEISGIGVLTAVVAGLVSFLSPCVLPLVPGYLSYVAGQSVTAPSGSTPGRMRTLGLSAVFVLGFSTVFIALGATATALGQLLLAYRYEAGLIGGAVVILFGLFMTGLGPMPRLQRELRYHGEIAGGRALGAYLLGLGFAFGWTPCIGPVLGSILAVSALSATVSSGIALLGFYSLGLAIPFLASALFTEGLFARLRHLRRAGRWLQVGAGAIMIVMGLAIITGQMAVFSFWLLDRFPALGAVG